MTQPLAFGRFTLDLNRGLLSQDGREIALRPKTFAVLCYLAQHPNRLIPHDELLAAVWPDSRVSHEVLEQSVVELSRAMGEAGAQFIKTDAPRGYRFDGSAIPDRRKSRGVNALRWRWIYGLLAPLALLLTFVVLWFGMRGCAQP